MQSRHYILGDWGTTRLRLRLYDESRSTHLEEASGPGVKDVVNFGSAFLDVARRFSAYQESLPVFLSGMAGANIGWREAPYVTCPATSRDIFEKAVRFLFGSHEICITPGVSCMNSQGFLDVMRGEEVQIIGAAHDGGGASSSQRRLFCLPGTHTKWAIMEDNQIERFDTSMQGELYDIIIRNSILVRPNEEDATDGQAFQRGLTFIKERPNTPITQALFSARSLVVAGEMKAEHARSYISGLLISYDIQKIACRLAEEQTIDCPILIIGADILTNLYGAGLELYGLTSQSMNGEDAVFAGLDEFRHFITKTAGPQ